MKFLVLISLSLLLGACSSSQKKSSDVAKSKETQNTELIIEDSSVGKGSKPIKKPVVVEGNKSSEQGGAGFQASSMGNPYSQLNNFIKNQEEESILKEGSRILMQNPSDVKALNAMAMVYYKRGQIGLAKSLLVKAQKSSPTYEVYSNLGIINLALDEKGEAVKNFKKAIEMNPNDIVSASNVGSIYIKANDFEKAVVALEIPYRKGSKDYRLLSNYAVALTGTGKYEKADQVYKEALKENNNSKEVLFNYSILLIEHLKRNQEGLEHLQKLKFIGLPDDSRGKVQELEAMARKEQK